MNILELIHQSGFVYNDLKPDNILIGYGEKILDQIEGSSPSQNIFEDCTINLIDFGLASKWRDSSTGAHRKQTQQNTFHGNLYFSSLDQLRSKTTSRRDDLIGLFNLLHYLLSNGNFDWIDHLNHQGHSQKEANDLEAKLHIAQKAKSSKSLTEMCTGRAMVLERFSR